MTSIIVTLPWPDTCLRPNAKRASHWSSYYDAARSARESGIYLTREKMGRIRFVVPPKITVEFRPPKWCRWDDDAMIGAFKHARDGIAQAIGHDDRTWRPEYRWGEKGGLGCVVVTIGGPIGDEQLAALRGRG